MTLWAKFAENITVSNKSVREDSAEGGFSAANFGSTAALYITRDYMNGPCDATSAAAAATTWCGHC